MRVDKAALDLVHAMIAVNRDREMQDATTEERFDAVIERTFQAVWDRRTAQGYEWTPTPDGKAGRWVKDGKAL